MTKEQFDEATERARVAADVAGEAVQSVDNLWRLVVDEHDHHGHGGALTFCQRGSCVIARSLNDALVDLLAFRSFVLDVP